VYDDHEPGCPLAEPGNWLRAAAGQADAAARLAEVADELPQVPAGLLRRGLPTSEREAVVWCTCGQHPGGRAQT
jgi:hypothetical protein